MCESQFTVATRRTRKEKIIFPEASVRTWKSRRLIWKNETVVEGFISIFIRDDIKWIGNTPI